MKRLLGVLLATAITIASAQEITLSYKYAKGDVYRYKEVITQSSAAEGMPAGGQMLKITRHSKSVVEAADKGTATLLQSTDSSTALMNDKPFSNPQMAGMEKMAFRVTVDATGKVLSAVPAEEQKDDAGKKIAAARAAQLKNDTGFPVKAVKAGESWNNETVQNQDTQMGKLTITTKSTTTYNGMETLNGLEVAVLSVTGTLSGEIGAGMGVITGKITGKRYFAVKEGYEVKMTAEVDQNMDIQTPQGNMMVQQKMTQQKERIK